MLVIGTAAVSADLWQQSSVLVCRGSQSAAGMASIVLRAQHGRAEALARVSLPDRGSVGGYAAPTLYVELQLD